MSANVLKFASCKKENRRIEVIVYDKEGDIATVIYTKRLIDKKKRHILGSTVSYGYESLSIIKDVLDILFNDPEFRSTTNRERGQLEKDAKWHIGTNIIYK